MLLYHSCRSPSLVILFPVLLSRSQSCRLVSSLVILFPVSSPLNTMIDNLVMKIGIIPCLTHNNYTAWTNAIKFALIGTKGWRIVNGDEEEPEVGITQRSRDVYKNYQDRADKALSLIYGSVTHAIQASIVGISNPRDMWITLQNHMDIVQNKTGSTYMRWKFHNEVYGSNETLDQYIGRNLSY